MVRVAAPTTFWGDQAAIRSSWRSMSKGTCASVLDACPRPPARGSAVSRRIASCASDARKRTTHHASASAIGAIRSPAINPTVGWSVPVAHSQAPRSSPARTAVAPSGRSGIPSEASGRRGRLRGRRRNLRRSRGGAAGGGWAPARLAVAGGCAYARGARGRILSCRWRERPRGCACARSARATAAGYPVATACGRSVVVAQKPSKLLGRVRFPSPACTTPRGVAQSGSAPGWGPGGRRFKSCLPDSKKSLQMRCFLAGDRAGEIRFGEHLGNNFFWNLQTSALSRRFWASRGGLSTL